MPNENGSNESTSRTERIKRFLREKGLYLVLIVCLVLVGAAAFLAFGTGGDAEQPEDTANVSAHMGDTLEEAVRATPSPTPVPDFTASPGTPAPTAQALMMPPVSGKVIWRFASDELIYSETLDQWMTHAAVDIAAKKGADVFCVLNGTVERVFTDDSLGVCVLIDHGDFSALYANLAEDPPVKEGRTVAARTVVGQIGDTAVSECGIQSHLHFAVYVDDRPMDPAAYFMFES